MKTYISEFAPKLEVTSFFLVSDPPVVRQSKKKQDYLCLKLFDKTGEVDSRVWDIPKELDVSTLKNCIVKVQGTVDEWKDELQFQVSKIRLVVEEDGVDMADFFERSERDPEEMFTELLTFVDRNVPNIYLGELLGFMLTQNATNFKLAPAGKSVHHAYLGGLLEHSLSLCELAIPLCVKYFLDPSLMIAACILHDIGKTRELSYTMGTRYTVEGNLLGHISIGMMMVSHAIAELPDFPPNLKMSLLHLIASHHGLLEYGSPKIPLTKEAIAFNLCDLMDSKMAMCDRILKKGVDAEGLADWSKEIGGMLWRMQE